MTAREIYWGAIRCALLGAMVWAAQPFAHEHPWRTGLTCFFAATFGATAHVRTK